MNAVPPADGAHPDAVPEIYRDCATFAAVLPPRGRLLGVDPGTRTLGLALSDAARTIATPWRTIPRRNWKADAADLQAAVAEQAVCALVMGYPLSMEGQDNPRTQSVRQLARNCVRALNLPVLLWDERLSTAAVERMMLHADMTRQRRAVLVDKLAAAYILQAALDAWPRPVS